MSARALNWAWQQSPATASQKLVLAVLADRADDEGFCYPSIKWVATKCAPMPERTARWCITELGKAGLLVKVERRRRADGTLGAWTYRLCLETSSGNGWPLVEPQPVATGCRTRTDHKSFIGTDVPMTNGDSPKKEKPKTPLELLWDACELHVQPAPESESHRKAYAKLVREMFAAGWTPAMVRDRAKAYRKSSLTGEWSLTLAALAKWGIVVAAENEPLMERLKRQDAERRAREGFTAGG